MKRLLVLEVPGLTRGMVERHAPRLRALGAVGSLVPERPAVTMPGHASLATGLPAERHGIVANGWYDRAHNEVFMWRQSERLVQGRSVWDEARARDRSFTCLKHFWWPGMASSADLCVNVRPVYFADGRKSGGVIANRDGIAERLQAKCGTFPLFKFWGPAAGIAASRWIAETARTLFDEERPTLSLVYLPHLDYKQQSHGPEHPDIASETAALDEVAGELAEHARDAGAEVMVLSGYRIDPVSRPVHINRLLRGQGWLRTTRNAAGELIDFAGSRAFAVADHQVAHVYCDADVREDVAAFLREQSGVGAVSPGLDHERAGDLYVEAAPGAWFTYYYWLADDAAPDFARTVAIHAKPGYDPCELFLDPEVALPKLRIAGKVLRKKLGFRMLMDLIPLDATLVRGSHGLVGGDDPPVFIDSAAGARDIAMTEVKDAILNVVFARDQDGPF